MWVGGFLAQQKKSALASPSPGGHLANAWVGQAQPVSPPPGVWVAGRRKAGLAGTEQQEKASVGRLALQVMGSVAKQTLSASPPGNGTWDGPCLRPDKFPPARVHPPHKLVIWGVVTSENRFESGLHSGLSSLLHSFSVPPVLGSFCVVYFSDRGLILLLE